VRVLIISTITILMFIFLIRSLYFHIILLKKLSKTSHRKRSLSVRYGKLTEQFFPLIREYPYNSTNFRFLGTPIDGIQFNEDSIVFVEFKLANSKLTPKQKRIKTLVENNKVRFEVFYIK